MKPSCSESKEGSPGLFYRKNLEFFSFKDFFKQGHGTCIIHTEPMNSSQSFGKFSLETIKETMKLIPGE